MQNKLLFTTLVLLACLCLDTFAQGDLIITPNRVIFEGRKYKEELNLINTGKETTTFSVSFVQRRMTENGGIENIEESDSSHMFADPYLRIYPRQVTLEPGEAQVVMLQLRRKSDMAAGEYRSHLYFRSEKDYTALGTENTVQETNSLSVQLTPIFGISIPIIIRTGVVHAQASFSDLKLENDEYNNTYLSFVLNRTGNISVYGNLKVEYISENGKTKVIGGINGIAVYTNLNKRFVSIKLSSSSKIDLKKGKLRLSYNSRDDAKKKEIFAEAIRILK